MIQINRLRDQVQSLKNSKKKTKVRVHPDIDNEDTILMTVRSFLDLQQCLEHMACPICKKKINELCLDRKSCQYKLHGVCESCYEQPLWINSEDYTKPDTIRKFIESMTISGVNF